MLKEKKLILVDSCTRYLEKEIKIQDVISYLHQELTKMHYNVQVNADTLKIGGIFNSSILDCIVITNLEHKKDYISVVIAFSQNKKRLSVYEMGESKQFKKHSIKIGNESYRKEVMKSSGMTLSQKIAHNLGNKIASSIKSIGLNSQKLQDEQDYIGFVLHLIEQI